MKDFSIFLRPRKDAYLESLDPLPWANEEIIHIDFKKGLCRYSLIVPSSKPFVIRFNKNEFRKVTIKKLSKDIAYLSYDSFIAFNKVISSNPALDRFSKWWIETAAKQGKSANNGRLFQFDFSQGPWEIPWEMLLGLLTYDDTRKSTSIVRCIGRPEEDCSVFQANSLKTLIIQASAPDLKLNEDVGNIISSWNGLEQRLKDAVKKPLVINADRSEIVKNLRKHKPDMLWFVGHSQFDSELRLFFSKTDSLTSEEFCELFDQAEYCPRFAIFWACESAKGVRSLNSVGPEFFNLLVKKGVQTFIGMQSSIADDAAMVMARHLFRGIAQGIPLEWAMSSARAWIYTINGQDTPTMDWAAPVIWTSKRPILRLDWKQTEMDRLQLQLLGSASIDRGQNAAYLDSEPPDSNAIRRAKNWLRFPFTVVRGNPESPEHRLWFLRTLKGIQAVSGNAVIVVIPWDGNYHRKNLQDWASGFLETLDHIKLPDDFLTKIDILRNDAEIGWRRLCTLDNVFLAVINPPPSSEDWFWTPFFQFPDNRAILTENEIPERFNEAQVNYATAGKKLDQLKIDTALIKYKRILTALSIINLPVRKEVLNKVDIGHNSNYLFEQWPDLFVRSFGGYVIRSDARDHVLNTIDHKFYRETIPDCIDIIERLGQNQKPYLKELKIQLLLDSDMIDDAVQEFSKLITLYDKKDERISLVRAVMNKRYFQLRDGLTTWEWLQIAHKFLQIGEQHKAQFWLSREPDHVLDIPLSLSLKAEYSKNTGDIEWARELLERAIEVCRINQFNDELNDDQQKIASIDLLKYRQDRARLLHFQEGKILEAEKEYRQIIDTIENEYPGRLKELLAISHRNIGECILAMESDPPNERFREATWHYQEALSLERNRDSFSPLIADIRYQLAKLFQKTSKYHEARNELELCIGSADESRYGLLAAIARNRLFWLDMNENHLGWADIDQRWDLIADSLRCYRRHSWSIRTLIDSNIKIAQLLISENNYSFAEERLRENKEILQNNTLLRRGSDLIRLVRTFAGLEIIKEHIDDNEEYWKWLLEECPDAAKKAESLGWLKPEDAW